MFSGNCWTVGYAETDGRKVGLKQVNIGTVKSPSAVMSSLHDGLLIITWSYTVSWFGLHYVIDWKYLAFLYILMFSLQEIWREWCQCCCCNSDRVKVCRVTVYALWWSILWWFIERSNMMRHVCGYGTEQFACSSMHAYCCLNWPELHRNQGDGKKFAPSPALILGYQVFT